MVGRDARINLLISTGHFLSHFYQLCLPPLFLVWQRQFDISFAELGLSVVLMTGAAAGDVKNLMSARAVSGARAPETMPAENTVSL